MEISTQVGLLDLEINRLTKVLFVATMVLAFVLVSLRVSDDDDDDESIFPL